MGSTQRRQPAPQGGRRRAAASWGAVAALAGASAVALAAVGAGGAATAVRAGSAATTSATSPAAAAGPSAAPAALAPSGPRTIAPAGRPAAGSSPTTAAAAVAPRAGSPAPSPAAVAVAAPAAGTTVPATAPPATATTAAYHRTTAPAVGRSGTALTLDGVRHQFVGVDAYQLGTDWGVNTGCGGMASDSQLSAFFASLPPASLVRIWGFQGSIGTTAATHQIDWAPLDRVFSAAAAHGDYIVLSLGDQAGTCDDSSWHGLDWYQGGYRDVVDPTGATPLSYWTYVQDAVAHFESSPALAMWEPMNEAEASTCAAGLTGSACFQGLTCPSESAAASALRSFFDAVGGEIHALDPRHLVESGLGSGGQCGSSYTDWTTIAQSPGLDVLSYHDYYPAGTLLGGDQWNGEALRISQAQSVDKPIIAGELGVAGYGSTTTSACPSLADRSADVVAKLTAQYAAGSAAELVWNADQGPVSACAYDVVPGDPLLSALARF